VARSYTVLAISGSLRARSSNTEVLRAAAAVAPRGVSVSFFHGLAGLPHFNPDLEDDGARLPIAVRQFRDRVGDADALLICSPEYAHGVPGSLKNALDWLVSGPEIPYKPVMLLNASTRSTHAQAALAETLRTMSTVVVNDAAIEVPLDGRRLDADSIVGVPELASRLASAWIALVAAIDVSRDRRAGLVPAAQTK
jgi:chromate reductase, NAD(P)H dehydrogenase (quinone)